MNWSILKWMLALSIALLVVQASCNEAAAPPTQPEETTVTPTTVLTTQQEKASYSIGVDLGNALKRQDMDLNIDALVQGLRHALGGEQLLMTDEEMQTVMTAFQTELMQKQAESAMKAAEENKKVGDTFLAENKTKEGVKTTASGLQYKIIKTGTGKKPTKNDSVECHYIGTLIDGTEFDSSYRRGQPATFPVSGVIPGWTEALQLMPVGSKWQLFIPAELAYGPQGAGGVIGPNQTLIFEIELLGIK